MISRLLSDCSKQYADYNKTCYQLRIMNNAHDFEIPQQAVRLIHDQASADINKFIKNTLGNNLMDLLQPIRSSSGHNQPEQTIKTDFAKINQIIDEIQYHLQVRFQDYQKDLLSIVKQQIELMNLQTKRLISNLHDIIQQRDVNNQIWSLRNQNDFFKSEALKLFELNKTLRLQISVLKKTIQDYEIQFEATDRTLCKIKKKQLKQRMVIKASLQMSQSGVKFLDRNRLKISKFKPRQTLDTNSMKRINTEGNQEISILQQPKIGRKFPSYTKVNNKSFDKLSIPIISYANNINDSILRSKLKNTDSYEILQIQKINQSKRSHYRKDKSTQTNFNLKLNLQTEVNHNQDLQDSYKGINLLRNGFVLNTPSRIRKQSFYRKSIDQSIQRSSADAVQISNLFAKNKLSSSLNKPKIQRALFKYMKQ